MSDVRLNIERIVERTSDLDGVEPLIRRVSSRIEGFGDSLDHARGRVLAILKGDESIELGQLNAAIAQVTQQFRDSAHLSSCAPTTPVLVPFLGGTEAMALCLGHLVFNSVKGRGGSGARHVSIAATMQPGNWVEIRIEDDGPGFSAEFLRSFADPKASAVPARGLALARLAVHDVGGSLVLSNLGARGAQVLLRLPVLPFQAF
jgi:C4-dicarboxylate-specific signal transduction histidine kinase